jgi:hypothetical protein
VQPAVMAAPVAGRLNWLSQPTFFLCLTGLILPNLFSLAAPLAGIGTPPRTAAIVAYATLVVLSRIIPPAATACLYVVIAAYDAIATLALLFNLGPSEVGLALELLTELKPLEIPLYVALTAGLGFMVGVNTIVLIRHQARLAQGSAVILMGLALGLAACDVALNTSLHYQFGTLYAAGRPIEAAAAESGFRAAATGTDRHVLLVMVEALGRFADPQRQAIMLQPLNDPELRKRYEVRVGATTYYGSTTAGEMRELCHTREPYSNFLTDKGPQCLPAIMAARGFRTVGMHNFSARFFEREQWYRNIGFQTSIFGEALAGQTPRLCGGAFKGPCDVDVVPLIGRELRDARRPTFLYWLTLSTHVPVRFGQGSNRLGCDRGGGALGTQEVCHMTEMWVDLLQALVALTSSIPPTEILIVGDHAPPLWSKSGRGFFEPGKVTWIRLVPRA